MSSFTETFYSNALSAQNASILPACQGFTGMNTSHLNTPARTAIGSSFTKANWHSTDMYTYGNKCTSVFWRLLPPIQTTARLDKTCSHTQGQKFECDICDYSSSQKRMLKCHVAIHQNKPKYKCIRCGEGFTHNNQLHQPQKKCN